MREDLRSTRSSQKSLDMTTFEFILNIVVGVTASLGTLFVGIYIGREFGTFSHFWLVILSKIKLKMKGRDEGG